MAFSRPYTYSDLLTYLSDIEKLKKKYVTREILCHTLAGNPCWMLTITSPTKIKKKGVILTGRVHPGEPVSSWMLQGTIDFLLSNNNIAKYLLNNFIFKIIPMLNPDGVIQGNYRCSLAGCDLNRRYLYPSSIFHPTIYNLKKMVRVFSKQYCIMFYCDFHGHSKAKNVFMYGNNGEENSEKYRVFPYIMSKINPYFSYKNSQFVVQKAKASTARIAMWKELNIFTVYTIEASFFGAENKLNDIHFEVEDLMNIGKSLCQALNIYYKMNEPSLKVLLFAQKIG